MFSETVCYPSFLTDSNSKSTDDTNKIGKYLFKDITLVLLNIKLMETCIQIAQCVAQKRKDYQIFVVFAAVP